MNKRWVKVLLSGIVTTGLAGYAPAPGSESMPDLRGRVAPLTAARTAPAASPRGAEPSEHSQWTLLLCTGVVVGFIARRKSRLVAR